MKYEGKVTDAAEYVDARGCTGLTKLTADAAKYVDVRGCTALTKLTAADGAKIYTGPLQWYWHIHHDRLFELEREPIEERIAYIKSDKPKDEVAIRLHLLKPIKHQAEFLTLYSANDAIGIRALHAEECPGCPWNGKTIFPRGE